VAGGEEQHVVERQRETDDATAARMRSTGKHFDRACRRRWPSSAYAARPGPPRRNAPPAARTRNPTPLRSNATPTTRLKSASWSAI
jgi:hypothetical protein